MCTVHAPRPSETVHVYCPRPAAVYCTCVLYTPRGRGLALTMVVLAGEAQTVYSTCTRLQSASEDRGSASAWPTARRRACRPFVLRTEQHVQHMLRMEQHVQPMLRTERHVQPMLRRERVGADARVGLCRRDARAGTRVSGEPWTG